MNSLYLEKSRDNLFITIIGTAFFLVIIHIFLLFFKESNPLFAEIPMFIPMVYVFAALASVCIFIMSLGRQRVLNDSVSFWTGIAFINIFITNIFYILSWPGLLANGLPIIGHNTNTAAWILLNENILITAIFFVASLISWPGKSALKGYRWTISILGWTFGLIILNILMIAFQDQLPLLVSNDQFTILSKVTIVLLILIMLPATIFMTLRYHRTKDQFIGFIALTLILLFFTYIEQIMTVSRYALLWYLGRLIGVSSYIVLLFGLLREYINLYRTEEEKSRHLSESERKTNEILNAITDSSFLIDKNWIITQINSKALEFFGMKREDIVDRLYWDVFPVTIGTFIEDNFRKAVSQNITFSFEMHSMVKEAWTEMHLYPSNEGLTVHFRDISERKRIEDALNDSEEKYRNIVETAGEGIIIASPEGKFQFVNNKFADMLGYSPEEILGRFSNEFIYDEPEKAKVKESRNHLRKGELIQREMKFRRKNGSQLWTLFNATPIIDAQNNHIGNLAMHTDITERKKIEEAISKSEKNYKDLVTRARTIIIKVDTEGCFTYFNEFAQSFFGYNEEEIIGKAAIDTIVPKIESTGRDLNEMAENLYEDPDKFAVNINENIKKNGEKVWVEWHNRSLFDDNGRRTGHLAIGIDITERKKAEQELRASEAKFRSISDTIPAFVYLTRASDGIIILANPACVQTFGFVEGKKAPELYVDFDDRTIINAAMQEQGSLDNYEFRVKRSDGSPIWLLISIRTIDFGGEQAFLGTAVEITDRKNAEINLIEREAQLMELNKTKDKFFNIVAHDLKNPFTSILGSSELLFENINEMNPENIKKLALILNESAKSGYLLLLNLLEWSRSQTGMLKILSEKINLKGTVDANIKNLELTAHNKGITIINEAEDNLHIISDINIINTILRNLLSNAIKFTHRSGKVVVRFIPKHDTVSILVTDNGVGIPQEKIGTLFNLNSAKSLPGTENEIGTGLGLKLSKELIEKLGGTISVESEFGKGSTFFCTIPRNNLQ